MHLQITKITPDLVNKAKSFFSDEYVNDLRNKCSFEESLVARYVIAHPPAPSLVGRGSFNSISHKKGLVFTAISENKVGIDIEIFKIRDISVLDTFSEDNYKKLGGKNWKNFYILWTAGEAIIKYSDGSLDDIGKYELVGVRNVDKEISGISFCLELEFEFGNRLFKVLSGKKDGLFFCII